MGPLKGYLCRVLAIRYSDVTVKLDSQQKVLSGKKLEPTLVFDMLVYGYFYISRYIDVLQLNVNILLRFEGRVLVCLQGISLYFILFYFLKVHTRSFCVLVVHRNIFNDTLFSLLFFLCSEEPGSNSLKPSELLGTEGGMGGKICKLVLLLDMKRIHSKVIFPCPF